MRLGPGLRTAFWLARGQPGRQAYLVLTVAVTVACWFVLTALASPFLTVRTNASEDVIRVNNARNRSAPLPIRYATRLAALPGVARVDYQDLQMLLCGDDTVTVNAINIPATFDELTVLGFDRAAIEAWLAEPRGALVSASAARLCGWRLGQGTEAMNIKQQPMPLQVSGIASVADDDPSVIAHYDYVNRNFSFIGSGKVLWYTLVARDPGAKEALISRVEAEFAHDDPPVAAFPDTVREDARARFGQVQRLVGLLMAALFLCCLLVLASVMAHSASERRAQHGLLCVLGFPRPVMLAGYGLEVLAIVLLGTLMGAALGLTLLDYLPGWLQGQFLKPRLEPWTYRLLPAWLLPLALLALLHPWLSVLRAAPLDAQEQ